jgi:hypothetical protein
MVITPGMTAPQSICNEVGNRFEDMDEMIQIYRREYPKDLSRRLGLDQEHLPPILHNSCAPKSYVWSQAYNHGTATELMTESQYDEAQNYIIKLIQDELDFSNPP